MQKRRKIPLLKEELVNLSVPDDQLVCIRPCDSDVSDLEHDDACFRPTAV
jgi:hypothetical protein